jgi:hypothetical protein
LRWRGKGRLTFWRLTFFPLFRGGRPSEFAEIELVPSNSQVFDDVSDDATRHIPRVPLKSDDAVGAEWIRIMTVAASVAQVFTSDFAQATFQLTTIERWVFAHRSGRENKFVAEGRRNWTARFQQRFQMGLGRLLKA